MDQRFHRIIQSICRYSFTHLLTHLLANSLIYLLFFCHFLSIQRLGYYMVHLVYYIHFVIMSIKVTHSFIHSFTHLLIFLQGDPNLCANSSSITFFAWNFKIFFAILTDIYRPFGLRRKPWMLFGWTMVLVILMVCIHSFTTWL